MKKWEYKILDVIFNSLTEERGFIITLKREIPNAQS